MKIETKRPIIKKKKVSGESIVKMKTEITELLGIEYPIIQGGNGLQNIIWQRQYPRQAVWELSERQALLLNG